MSINRVCRGLNNSNEKELFIINKHSDDFSAQTFPNSEVFETNQQIYSNYVFKFLKSNLLDSNFPTCCLSVNQISDDSISRSIFTGIDFNIFKMFWNSLYFPKYLSSRRS